MFSCFFQITKYDIGKTILAGPYKSCSLDPWPTFLVKKYIDLLKVPIAKIVNLSLWEGTFPTQFMKAVIAPFITLLLTKSNLDKSQ